MLSNAADIRAELEKLANLPVPVSAWLVEEGIDATDDPAVWVWALIEPDDLDADRVASLTSMVGDFVRNASGVWAYVLVRGVDETEAAA